MKCVHKYYAGARWWNKYRLLKNPNLAKKNIYVLRCGLCGLIKCTQLVSFMGLHGPRVRVLTYFPKNIEVDRLLGLGEIPE